MTNPEPASPVELDDRRIRVRRFAGHRSHAQRYVDPVRVVQLTDLHFGRVTPVSVQRDAVARANAAKPDLVVLTGDYVCHSQSYFDAIAEVLGELEAPTYAVLGNHDHWCHGPDVAEALERAGVEVLRNAWTEVTFGPDRRLQLVGLDDAYTGHADVEQATRGLDPTRPALALSHIAEEAESLWARGAEFVLSGHTHGGQIHFENMTRMTFAAMAGHRFVHGLYGSRNLTEDADEPQGAVYVNAGIGTSVMPLRLGARGKRELAVFDLGLSPGTVPEDHVEQLPLPGRSGPTLTPEERRERTRKKAARRRQR